MLKSLSQISRAASIAATPREALDLLLSWAAERQQSDLGALYRYDGAGGGFRLLAARGERQPAPRPLGPAESAARRREPVFGDGADETVRKRLAGSGFRDCLSVPLIRFGRVVAVLEILRSTQSPFDDEDAALLQTLGVQMAVFLEEAKQGQAPVDDRQRVFFGAPGAPGLAIGVAVIPSARNDLNAVDDRAATDTDAQIEQFNAAVDAVRLELQSGQARMSGRLPSEVMALYDVYALLLGDSGFLEGVLERIRAGQWAPAALRDAVRETAGRFETMEDPYLSRRAEDVRALGRRILRYLNADAGVLGDHPERTVLVGEEVGVPRMGGMDPERLVGVASRHGSVLSHGAIVARALGIPSVIGVKELPLESCHGRTIIIDGYRGRVILNPGPEVKARFQRLLAEEHSLNDSLDGLRDLPARTTDGRTLTLQANIALLNEIDTARACGAQGVGLYRSEMPFLLRESLPGEEAQYTIYRELLEAFAPQPVTIRTLDAGGDKALPYLPLSESNPTLGQRGLRLTLEHPGIFLTQAHALLRANAGVGNLRLLLPMVTSSQEVRAARALLEQARQSLAREGLDVPLPPLGLMLEVPAAVLQARELAGLADFLSIGSNDLIQFIQAADRTNPHVADLCDPLSPAVLRAIGMAVDQIRATGTPVGVCGEMAGDPLAALLLLGLGVDSLSMSSRSIPRVKQVIRAFDASRARRLWEQAIAGLDAPGIRSLLLATMDEAGLGGLVRAGK